MGFTRKRESWKMIWFDVFVTFNTRFKYLTPDLLCGRHKFRFMSDIIYDIKYSILR